MDRLRKVTAAFSLLLSVEAVQCGPEVAARRTTCEPEKHYVGHEAYVLICRGPKR